jgi:hypothetical protein
MGQRIFRPDPPKGSKDQSIKIGIFAAAEHKSYGVAPFLNPPPGPVRPLIEPKAQKTAKPG